MFERKLRRDGDEGFNGRLNSVDAIQECLRQLDGRDVATVEEFPRAARRHAVEVGVVHRLVEDRADANIVAIAVRGVCEGVFHGDALPRFVVAQDGEGLYRVGGRLHAFRVNLLEHLEMLQYARQLLAHDLDLVLGHAHAGQQRDMPYFIGSERHISPDTWNLDTGCSVAEEESRD